MTTIEKKNYIKQKIDSIENEEILDRIEKILEGEKVYQLSDEQILKIQEAREEYVKGNFLTNEQANEDIEKWFKEEI